MACLKKLIIVTGSSRGIGLAIAQQFNSFCADDALIILMARDSVALASVKKEMIAQSRNKIETIQVDFAVAHEVSAYFEMLKSTLQSYQELNQFEELVVVYNHGTLEFGSVSLKAQEPLRQRFEINLFSIWTLLSAVNLLLPVTVIPKQFHVNISSGYGYQPHANWSVMCSTRAAKDMMFNCFALEQPSSVKVLNYAPGLVFTDMLSEWNNIDQKDGYESAKVSKPEDVSRFLVKIIAEDSFKTGSRVKYEGSGSH